MADGTIPVADDTMGLSYRVELTVYAWAGSTATVPTTTALKDVWAIAGLPVSEYPDPATYDLIAKLTAQFNTGNDARDLSQLTPNYFIPGTAIQTIDDLASFVMNSPTVITPVAAPDEGVVDTLAAGADTAEGGE